MNNETYTFIQTQKERNSMRHGAFARKDGSKSKRCSLPSDNLSPAQKRKLNGPLESINLNQPMTYAELKAVSPSLRSTYLHHLVDDLGARRKDLMGMLGISDATMFKLLKSLPEPVVFQKGRPKVKRSWLEFLKVPVPETQGEDIPPEVIVEAPAPDPTPEPEKVDPNPPQPIVIQSGSFTIHGTAADLLATLARLIDTAEPLTYTLSFTA